MYDLTIRDIINNSKAKLLIGNLDEKINECTVDSKKVTNGSCFFGIKGEKVNGSLFYKEALEKGAKIVVINKIYDLDLTGYDDRCVVVCENVLQTLQDLAAYKRSLFKGKVIAVTGSVGKTSTKNMIVSVLKNKYKVLTNNNNENSQIGLPLTILRLKDEDAMTLEMGMSKTGELSILSKIAKPDISVITNIGMSHYKYFNSKEEILNAKLEIIDGMESGVLLLNNDDDLLKNTKVFDKNISVITYGIENNSDYIADNISENDSITFSVKDILDIKIDNPYEYIYNALVSIIIGKMFNIDSNKIKESLYNFKNEKHRLEEIMLDNNILLIDDTYNASYKSVMSSLNYIKKYNKRKIVVLADILELGNMTKHIHRKIGKELVNIDIDVLITIGKYSKYIGKYKKNIIKKHFKNELKARCYIKKILKENDLILLKGSNSMKLINIVNYLKGE